MAARAAHARSDRGRRTSSRWPLDARVYVTAPVDAFGLTLNVSAGGIRVALNRELAVGMRCHLRIVSSEDNETTERAQIVWSRPAPDGCVHGLRFLGG